MTHGLVGGKIRAANKGHKGTRARKVGKNVQREKVLLYIVLGLNGFGVGFEIQGLEFIWLKGG